MDIIIQDWTGKILFTGPYDSPEVDQVLNANRCHCSDDEQDNCKSCDGTGYSGDFEIFWNNPNDERNVYEWVNY